MKKTFLTILALCSATVFTSAQGTMVMDSSMNSGDGSGPTATTGGLVWIQTPTNIVLDTSRDINVGLLWGTTSSNITTSLNLDPMNLNAPPSPNWLAGQATGTEDITFLGNGAIVDPNGESYIIPGEAAGTTIWLVVQGWLGNSTTYSGAGLSGQTAPFSITLSLNSSPNQVDIHTMGALVLTPEPSLPVLCSLAATAFALFRRRK